MHRPPEAVEGTGEIAERAPAKPELVEGDGVAGVEPQRRLHRARRLLRVPQPERRHRFEHMRHRVPGRQHKSRLGEQRQHLAILRIRVRRRRQQPVGRRRLARIEQGPGLAKNSLPIRHCTSGSASRRGQASGARLARASMEPMGGTLVHSVPRQRLWDRLS